MRGRLRREPLRHTLTRPAQGGSRVPATTSTTEAAHAVDGTGDGAGLMTRIPHKLLARELDLVPTAWPTGGMGPRDGVPRQAVLGTVRGRSSRRRSNARAWTSSPGVAFPSTSGPSGALAQETKPRIEQAVVRAREGVTGAEMFERKLFLARKAAERGFIADGLTGVSIPSASCRTAVYKGLFTAIRIDEFYLDLNDPTFEDRLRDLPPALLDQHRSLMGAGTAGPDARSQR